MAETLRCLVLQPLPLVLQLLDVLLDPCCAKAFVAQNLLSLFDGVLQEQESEKSVHFNLVAPNSSKEELDGVAYIDSKVQCRACFHLQFGEFNELCKINQNKPKEPTEAYALAAATDEPVVLQPKSCVSEVISAR